MKTIQLMLLPLFGSALSVGDTKKEQKQNQECTYIIEKRRNIRRFYCKAYDYRPPNVVRRAFTLYIQVFVWSLSQHKKIQRQEVVV